MDLLDRYLQAVRFWLPRAQADDIIAELSEDIRSQMSEEESRLGRPLNNSEVESILKKRGRPVVVASRYQPQRSLIGPGLFPAYWLVLKITLGVYLGIRFLVWLGFLLSDPNFRLSHVLSTIAGAWGPVWGGLFTSFGWVTLVFALLDRQQTGSNCGGDWNPLSLPPVRNPNRITRANAAFELAANLVFIMWWSTSMRSTTVFDMNGVRIVFLPVWRYFFWAFLATALASAAFATVNLVQPYWNAREGNRQACSRLRRSGDLVLALQGKCAGGNSSSESFRNAGRRDRSYDQRRYGKELSIRGDRLRADRGTVRRGAVRPAEAQPSAAYARKRRGGPLNSVPHRRCETIAGPFSLEYFIIPSQTEEPPRPVSSHAFSASNSLEAQSS